ncbi:iron ABC transporter permease [Bosea caraganae]|uniref:Iron ABC transporter permease n=1 Tax=Bosea caraganae TaxID=2763117 RepID=A0A370LCV9_9HYPH|nr:iron ABC transporter permease [Bosea caraganae]RDJ27791.1 iron ABC transporter permease [Bosea caraganae]RDJ29804.1 iron ABC transporter permease [Bosea caraganae]
MTAALPLGTTATADYRQRNARRLKLVGLGLAALVFAVALDVSIGPGNIPLADVLRVLVDPQAAEPRLSVIVWDLRLPIALMALTVGAMLGLSGAGMQTILANPLADPFTLGVSAAATVGASVAIVTGWSVIPGAGVFIVTANAFVFALAASLVLFFMTKLRGVSAETMILVGIALLFTCNAITALMQYRSNEVQLTQIVFWTLGSLARATWGKVGIAACLIALALPFFLMRGWALTALRLGDERAESLGVRVDRLRLEILVATSLLAAVSVSFVGGIGFIGLVGPHIARLLVGEDQRFFLPVATIASATLLSLASSVSKAINPGVIYPIGIITALIGVPFFVSLVMSIRSKAA